MHASLQQERFDQLRSSDSRPYVVIQAVDERGEYVANRQNFFMKCPTEIKLKDSRKTRMLQDKVVGDRFLTERLLGFLLPKEEAEPVYNLADEYTEFLALKMFQRLLKAESHFEQIMPEVLDSLSKHEKRA